MLSRQIQRQVGMVAEFKSPLSPLLQRGEPFDNGLRVLYLLLQGGEPFEYEPLMCPPLCKRGAGGDFSTAEFTAMAS